MKKADVSAVLLRDLACISPESPVRGVSEKAVEFALRVVSDYGKKEALSRLKCEMLSIMNEEQAIIHTYKRAIEALEAE